MNSTTLSRHRGAHTSCHVLLRLLLSAAVSLPLVVFYGEALVNSWLSAYWTVFSWVAADFKLLNLYIDHEGADRVVRAQVMWQHIVFIGDHVIYPDPRGTANASTLLAHALQGPLVAVLTTLAWPTRGSIGQGPSTRRWLEWAARVVALPPLLAILVLIDMPVVLAGELWDLALDSLDPGSTSALVLWKQFMQGGGRYALGLAAGVLVILAARRISQFVSERLSAAVSTEPVLSTSSSR